jgi:uncharacterized protein
MSELKTPGVYVEEVTKFPPSVAEVETAIPAFIGYTEKAPSNKPKRITSLLEYETFFGKAKKEKISLINTEDDGLTLETPKANFLMYYSLQMYFANGGGPCYIVSVGNYSSAVKKDDLKAGLDLLEDEDEPTLIIFPDAISLTDQEQFYAIYQNALDQAINLRNRFVILDTYEGNSINTTLVGVQNINTITYFRNKISTTNYGAAYFPHLETILNYTFDESATITHTGLQVATGTGFYANEIDALISLQTDAYNEINNGVTTPNPVLLGNLLAQAITIVDKVNETADVKIDLSDAKEVLEAINEGIIDDFNADQIPGSTGSFTSEFQQLIDALTATKDLVGAASGKTLEQVKTTNSALYHQIKEEIALLKVILPPSSTMAGVYAKVDSTKGVWKAPANISLNYVIAPTEKVSNVEQESLNVDDASGKPINAIRNLSGKGTLVWGARTLNGNSDDWRYIAVRRFFSMVEQSLTNAASKFKDEPNDVVTWLRAKAMVENFLNQQWVNGALLGSTPKEAYSVEVDYGGPNTMKIKIDMAVVRPAEFITLNFSCKL